MATLADRAELIGFFSYSRDDDVDSGEALTRLRARIQSELRTQLGRSRDTLRLWQDAEAISPGTLWEGQIDAAVAQSVFFIPIVTPRVVASKYCGLEFDKFLARERELGRDDLVFPILFVDVGDLADETIWRASPILRAIGERQYVDWREFRYDPDSVAVRRAVAQFCAKIVLALRKPARTTTAAREAVVGGGPEVVTQRDPGPDAVGGMPPHDTGALEARWPGLARRLHAFDERRLPLVALCAYAVVVGVVASVALTWLVFKENWGPTFDKPNAWILAPGVVLGLAIGLAYVVLGYRRIAWLLVLVVAATLGWAAAIATSLSLIRWFGSPVTFFWRSGFDFHAGLGTPILAASGLVGGLVTLVGGAVLDRGLFNARRFAWTALVVAALGALMGASMFMATWLNGGVFAVVLILLAVVWQVAVAMSLLHGRAAAIASAAGARIS